MSTNRKTTRVVTKFYVQHKRFGWREYAGTTMNDARAWIAERLNDVNDEDARMFGCDLEHDHEHLIVEVTETVTTTRRVFDHTGKPIGHRAGGTAKGADE